MSFTVNTNTLSLTAQNNLSRSQDQLNTAIERLSSGSKINSAKDDAAGQAIANRMTSQISGLNQAASNANDGISLAQTTEGALDQVNDNLQRVRELTVQASNGTNSQSDLSSIQDEINQRMDEIDRISSQTSFNGTNVLDGSKTTIDIQVGSEDGQTISINLQKVNKESLGLANLDVTQMATTVEASDLESGGAAASADATFAFTDNGTNTTDTDGATVLKGSNDQYYVRTADGKTYDATVTSDGSNSVAVAFSSDTEVTSEAASIAGLNPLADLDNAIKAVDNNRSGLGAVQNRLDSAISNIESTTINLSSARSRILDTDYAETVSAMSKAQILQQAGTSVLAQANQSSQGVLSLLR